MYYLDFFPVIFCKNVKIPAKYAENIIDRKVARGYKDLPRLDTIQK